MMKRVIIRVIVLLAVMIPAQSFAKANLILNLTPGFIVYSPDVDGFEVSDGWKTDQISGSFSNIAALSAGVGVDTPGMFFDMTVGAGYLWSSFMKSDVLMGDVACRFKIRRDEMTLGPHLTFLRFSPDWEGDSKIKLSDETGVAGGLSFTIGSKAFSIIAALDYMHLDFKIEEPRLPTNPDSLNMSGIVFQIGMLMRF
ncbi:MAG: DUF481 domain-containing protein [Desulfobacteraceae bacterium]|nr:DUF481 domain-containing protein [Desulfobacteraceae bacterium]